MKETKETLKDRVTGVDDTKIWRLINSLNGTPNANSPNEVMVLDEKRIIVNEQKLKSLTLTRVR